MKLFNCSKVRLILVVFVAAIVICSSNANADFVWGSPTNLGPAINSPYGEGGVSISADRLEFYFMSDRPGGYGGYDLWVMKRPTVEEDWGSPVNLGSPPNSQYSYWEPCISSDGLSLYFSDGHSPQFGNHLPGGLGGQGDIWVITRPTKLDAWSEPENIGPAVNSEHAVHPSISADGLSLYFQSHRPGRLGGHCDIMVATRESTSDTFGAPVFLENVNTTGGDWIPDISADGRTLFFSRGPATEIWMARRTGVQDDFDPPVKLPPQINVPSCTNTSPTFSRDGRTLYFGSDRPGGSGGWDLWQVPIIPIVDFNGDRIVDLADFSKLAQYWQQNEHSVDIAPPIGNGIVDVQDVAVLAEYWLQEVGLFAHWTLDETAGTIAHDSAGNNDGTLHNSPTWQPTNGKLSGALQFDGIDDYISTPFVLNPAHAPFSVFVWVKGSVSGQVIMSQAGSANWLSADPSEGKLMTDLAAPAGRFPPQPLTSQSVITDGNWHRVGFTWGGSNRVLYVDDVEVARDTQSSLAGSEGGLYFGAGKNREPSSFFSGLIDDVKIYNRAVAP